MPAILKIGYKSFLIKSEAAAIAALKALSDAVEVRYCYHKGDKVWFPDERPDRDGVEITIVKQSQLRRCAPAEEVKIVSTARQLENGPDVFHMDGGEA